MILVRNRVTVLVLMILVRNRVTVLVLLKHWLVGRIRISLVLERKCFK